MKVAPLGAYSECVDVAKSQESLMADVDFPQLASVCGKLRRYMSNTCPCACRHGVSVCANKPEHEEAHVECYGAGTTDAGHLPSVLHGCCVVTLPPQAETTSRETRPPNQFAPPTLTECYDEVIEHNDLLKAAWGNTAVARRLG